LADLFDIGAQIVTARHHGRAILLEVGTVGVDARFDAFHACSRCLPWLMGADNIAKQSRQATAVTEE